MNSVDDTFVVRSLKLQCKKIKNNLFEFKKYVYLLLTEFNL